jgi:hypothetical protein
MRDVLHPADAVDDVLAPFYLFTCVVGLFYLHSSSLLLAPHSADAVDVVLAFRSLLTYLVGLFCIGRSIE